MLPNGRDIGHKGLLWASSTQIAVVAISKQELSPRRGGANVDIDDWLEYDPDTSLSDS